MIFRTFSLISIGSLFASCSAFRSGPAIPTTARPEDVATADVFFKTNQGRGLIPDAAQIPALNPTNSGFVVELDQQRAYYYCGEQLVAFTKLSSGRPNYRTETGAYVLGQKDLNHRSNLYGDYVDATSGTIMVKDAMQGFDPRPVGAKFQGSLMKYFQRFNTTTGETTSMGFHTGILPGSAASHGCVRLPNGMAEWFFEHAPLGTPVFINGTSLGVPRGTVQKRPKREPKIHPASMKIETPTVPVPPAAGSASVAPSVE